MSSIHRAENAIQLEMYQECLHNKRSGANGKLSVNEKDCKYSGHDQSVNGLNEGRGPGWVDKTEMEEGKKLEIHTRFCYLRDRIGGEEDAAVTTGMSYIWMKC